MAVQHNFTSFSSERILIQNFVMAYIAEVVNGQYRDDFPAPMKILEKSDIDVRCLADANNTVFSATYSIVLIDN